MKRELDWLVGEGIVELVMFLEWGAPIVSVIHAVRIVKILN